MAPEIEARRFVAVSDRVKRRFADRADTLSGVLEGKTSRNYWGHRSHLPLRC
jgi:hypothetical protein